MPCKQRPEDLRAERGHKILGGNRSSPQYILLRQASLTLPARPAGAGAPRPAPVVSAFSGQRPGPTHHRGRAWHPHPRRLGPKARAVYPAGAPFLSKKWGKEDQGEGVSSPLDPSSLVGGALRAVPWPGDGPAAQARQVGCVRACRLGAQGLWVWHFGKRDRAAFFTL